MKTSRVSQQRFSVWNPNSWYLKYVKYFTLTKSVNREKGTTNTIVYFVIVQIKMSLILFSFVVYFVNISFD
jgi:hypothetical protein